MKRDPNINLVLTDDQRAEKLWQLLYEDPSPVENKYVVEIVDRGICHASYFSDATCQLDALSRASSDYFASHSHAGVSHVFVIAFCESCDEEDSDNSRTDVHFSTFPIPSNA
jgi:hypothetical protein